MHHRFEFFLGNNCGTPSIVSHQKIRHFFKKPDNRKHHQPEIIDNWSDNNRETNRMIRGKRFGGYFAENEQEKSHHTGGDSDTARTEQIGKKKSGITGSAYVYQIVSDQNNDQQSMR